MKERGMSFGEELRRERELRQISLREVAEATKINLRYLEALETNEFEHLPGGVFNRGFVRAYAQHIGVDPDAMVNAYLLEEQSANGDSPQDGDSILDTYRSIVKTRRVADGDEGPPWLRWLVIGAVVVAVLGLGALLYFKFAAPSSATTAGQATPAGPEPQVTSPVDLPESHPGPEPATPGEGKPEGGAIDAGTEPEPVAATPRTPPREHGPAASATVFIDRPVTGRLNCDNRQFEVLEGMRAGARLDLSCRAYLIVDASDAGALRIALPGRATVPLGPDGQALTSHRIEIPAPAEGNVP
jgi:cytoskeletal protein RodZ